MGVLKWKYQEPQATNGLQVPKGRGNLRQIPRIPLYEVGSEESADRLEERPFAAAQPAGPLRQERQCRPPGGWQGARPF